MNFEDLFKKSSGPFPDCEHFHERFTKCLMPSMQAKHIYKHNEAENCGEFVHDWRKCMSAKLVKEPEKIKVK